MARYMGIDVGTERIGVAFSDPGGRIASAHSTVEVADLEGAADELASLADRRDAVCAVFGWPVRMDGSEGRSVEMVDACIEAFERAVDERDLQIEIERWDERLSSKAAESVLIDADLTREKRRGTVDRVAAARILQNFLDAKGT